MKDMTKAERAEMIRKGPIKRGRPLQAEFEALAAMKRAKPKTLLHDFFEWHCLNALCEWLQGLAKEETDEDRQRRAAAQELRERRKKKKSAL